MFKVSHFWANVFAFARLKRNVLSSSLWKASASCISIGISINIQIWVFIYPLELKVSSIYFRKNTLFLVKLTPRLQYIAINCNRLEACIFIGIYLTKIFRGKLSEIIKTAVLENPFRKTFVKDSFLIKLQG